LNDLELITQAGLDVHELLTERYPSWGPTALVAEIVLEDLANAGNYYDEDWIEQSEPFRKLIERVNRLRLVGELPVPRTPPPLPS
jgi:hypothetical protein